MPRVAAAALVALVLLIVCLVPPAAKASVERGLSVTDLGSRWTDPAVAARLVDELAGDLRARWVRMVVEWPQVEPEQGQYDEAALTALGDAVAALHARGVKVVLTFTSAPVWASDRSFWNDPPSTTQPKGYSPYYPVRDDALDYLTATAGVLAARYAGMVTAYECWNEPNLWLYLYPQRTAADEYFGARTYLKYLRAFSAGVRAGDAAALVVAGSTAPFGPNDEYRSSPQKFARFLKDHDAAALFDVYSHHPYTIGGTRDIAPDGAPTTPEKTVALSNLDDLLRLFPGKPFYLTEYGYNTTYSSAFGGFSVTKVQQATFLRAAYAYVSRYPQVKNLFWFLVQDRLPDGRPADGGFYTGLRELDGDRKLGWFAFAGQNRLTISAPRSARRGSLIRITGRLSNAAIGQLRNRTIVLQSRKIGGGSWHTVTSKRTSTTGAYRFTVKPGGSRVYRTVWRGVKTSAYRTVRVY